MSRLAAASAACLIMLCNHCLGAEPPWVAGLAEFISDQDSPDLTDQTLAARLKPFIEFDEAACLTRRQPSQSSQAPVSAAIIAYEDDDACNESTALRVLQLNLHAPAVILTRLRNEIVRLSGPSCFSGTLPAEAERRAPRRVATVWRAGRRRVALAQEGGRANDLAVTLLVTSESAGAGNDLAGQMLQSLPQACR